MHYDFPINEFPHRVPPPKSRNGLIKLELKNNAFQYFYLFSVTVVPAV